MFDLDGKRALVTGATGGIGGAIAKALHDGGASVAISGTREEKLAGLAEELKERVHPVPCNLSDLDAVDALPKQASEAMGRLPLLRPPETPGAPGQTGTPEQKKSAAAAGCATAVASGKSGDIAARTVNFNIFSNAMVVRGNKTLENSMY